jgi:MFS family permease
MVRAITPEGNAGKVFGFMSTGHLVGGVIVPVLYGWIIDQGEVRWIFWITALLMVIAMLTLFSPARLNSAPTSKNG